MTVEELLTPRVFVLTDYPNCIFKIRKVFTPTEMQWKITKFDQYPNIFRILPWHEGRKVEDMPKYVRLNEESANDQHCGLPYGKTFKVLEAKVFEGFDDIFLMVEGATRWLDPDFFIPVNPK